MSDQISGFVELPLVAGRREAFLRAARDVTSSWRREALDEYIRLRAELDRLTVKRENFDSRTADDNLDTALLALAPRAAIGLTLKDQGLAHWTWRHLREWVSGSRIEDAWGALHRAQEAMLMILDEHALRREAPRLERELAHLPKDDPAARDDGPLIDKLRDPNMPTTPEVRRELRDLLEAAHGASDRYQRQVRDFRNKMFVACGLIAGFLLAAGVLHALNTDIVSVCAGSSPHLSTDLCPDGTPTPDGFDVLGVELVGAGGGLLTALVPLVTGQHLTGTPRVFTAQVALKVHTGALSGFLGVLLLEGGLLAGLAVQQGSKIYAYAAFFGLAQQVLTGFVDRKAGSLAKASPSDKGAQ
jgi:hypothetical protein